MFAGTYPPYDLAVEADILIKNKEGDVFQGLVWNDVSTVWPDFTNPKAHDYWIQLLNDFHKLVPFDGLWIVSFTIIKKQKGNVEATMHKLWKHPK